MPIFGPGNQNISAQQIQAFAARPEINDSDIINEVLKSGVSLDQIQQALPNDPRFTNENALPFLADRGFAPPASAQQGNIPIGLQGSEQAQRAGLESALSAIETGTGAATDAINRGIGGVNTSIGQGINALQPFADTGRQSLNVQAGLAGALGADAQKQAFADFSSSPGQNFLRDRGERALVRNAAALGGLGGGRVRQALQREGIGFAAQDFDNSFRRLGSLTDRGLNAANAQAGLRTNQAGNIAALTGQLGGINANAGAQAGNFAFNTGNNLATGRTRVAENLSGNINNATQTLAGLNSNQGKGLSDLLGSSAANLGNLTTAAGDSQAQLATQLATLLSNLSVAQGSQLTNVQRQPGILPQIGQLLSGVGTGVAAFGRGG